MMKRAVLQPLFCQAYRAGFLLVALVILGLPFSHVHPPVVHADPLGGHVHPSVIHSIFSPIDNEGGLKSVPEASSDSVDSGGLAEWSKALDNWGIVSGTPVLQVPPKVASKAGLSQLEIGSGPSQPLKLRAAVSPENPNPSPKNFFASPSPVRPPPLPFA